MVRGSLTRLRVPMHDLLDLLHRLTNVREIITWGGYVGLTAVIFAETGLLVGFFLPGDSLIVTAGLFAAVDSSDAVPPQATSAVFREVARTWWGNSVAATGAGSAWIEESFPAWTALAARGVLQGDSVRQRLVAQVEAGWRAATAGAGDLPLSAIVPGSPRADLLRTKGVAAIEAMRRALGEARFREALLSLTREHRNGWLTLDTVLAAAGPDVSTVLRSFLYQ